MGRPLNKRFFSGGTGTTVGCSYHDGSSVIESAIISQKSNTQYRVAGTGGAAIGSVTNVAFLEANPDTITKTGGTSFVTLGMVVGDFIRVAASENSGENDGVYEVAVVAADVLTLTLDGDLITNAADTTATLHLVSSVGVLGRLVSGAPAALGQMQVTVTPENAQTPTTANIGFTSASGTGALLTVFVDNVAAHYGYWTNGVAVGIAGTTDGTVDYQVANGKITAVQINAAGVANIEAESPVALDDAALADPPVQSAKIINARTVKTFEGTTYDWPPTAPLGNEGPGRLNQAALQTTDL